MKIRKGELFDWKELLQILNSTNELQGFEEGKTYTREGVTDSLLDNKRNVVLVLENKKKIAGFLIAEIFKRRRYSFLDDIFIAPEYRKKGLASKLLNEYEKYCKKINLRSIITLVLNNNFKMQNLIERREYKKGNLLYYYEKRLK